MIAVLVILVLLFIFISIFVGFNLSNTCNFWFFHHFTDVHVFVLVLFAFLAGVVLTLIAVLIGKIVKTIKNKKSDDNKINDENNQ